MTENVRLQNLRDFTVQIRDANDRIVGTGIAVSTDGKIVTCAHVVRAAGVELRDANSAEVGVYFPQARGGEEKNRRATVAKYFTDFDDDVVLLQLTGGSSPLAPEQIAVIGMAEESDRNEFRSYGYRPLPPYVGGWADGIIMGSVDSPPKLALQVEPVQLKSQQIAEGMSGSGVLDTERNLLVGIVSETYYPPSDDPKNRDTAWSVNARVLSLAPLGLTVQDIPLDLKPAPEPKTDEKTKQQVVQVAQITVEQRTIEEKYSWNNAPSVLSEWTGRDDLLKQITEDWNDPSKHVTGLIGFGGEGKSSLARKWVDTIIAPPPGGVGRGVGSPDGVFWWGFYENRNVDEFLEAALKYMSGGRIDPRQVQSSNLRAQIIGAMLGAGRYLFVLDGLEVIQHQEGDQYGLLQSNDLRDLLTFFARPDNASFCLVTSRAPLLDLMDYTTYTHRDVERLSEEDGRELLRRLGVKGSDDELNKVVADWDGHALTLSLISSYLVRVHDGDISHIGDFDLEKDEEIKFSAPNQYKHIRRVLRHYDEHLTDAEREFLKLFSAFRVPVKEDAFEKIFRVKFDGKGKGLNALLELSMPNNALSMLSSGEFDQLVDYLIFCRLLKYDLLEDGYTTHPLIRDYYYSFLKYNDLIPVTVKVIHEDIGNYYISLAKNISQYPTLNDLKPLIEVVHHACQAGYYDTALSIFDNRISGEQRIFHELGAYETVLNIFYEFFLGDLEQAPMVSTADGQRYILSNIGYCLMCLGRLQEAASFYERSVAISESSQDKISIGASYRNLATLNVDLGVLEVGADFARRALETAYILKNKRYELFSLSSVAWIEHLFGNLDNATEKFLEAENLNKKYGQKSQNLHGIMGIEHANHLRRTGELDYAHHVTESNLKICEKEHWTHTVSQCHRVLGDLDFDSGNHVSARAHYESALKIARGNQQRNVLIETLLARGRWQAKYIKNTNEAFSDLNEALGYCVESGYRIYEADVRVALGWAYLANAEKQKAKESAERALQMSNEMVYHWGKVDAKEVLDVIARRVE